MNLLRGGLVALMMYLLTYLLGGCDHTDKNNDSLPVDLARLQSPQHQLIDFPFKQANRAARLTFPRDHFSHPEFKIEWWYITANLLNEQGQHFSLQWTLFRHARPYQDPQGVPRLRQLYMAHVAIGDRNQHLAAQKFGREVMGHAGVEQTPFDAYIDNWRLRSRRKDRFFPLALSFEAGGTGKDEMSASLQLTNHGPVMLQGESGYSRKSHPDRVTVQNNNASHYYSMPWLHASGDINLGGLHHRVTGVAWLDREWTSALLTRQQSGWDWLSLHLNDGSALMVYQLRSRNGEGYRFAKLMAIDGQQRQFSTDEIVLTPLEYTRINQRDWPTRWRIQLPPAAIDITLSALNPRQYMPLTPPYWEGAVMASGSHSGQGFLELTGY